MTLNELNAARRDALDRWDHVLARDGWTQHTEYAVGRNGRQRSYRGTAGARLHLLKVARVTGKPTDARTGTFEIGDARSIHGACGANGQFTGTVVAGVDLDQITCTKCLKKLAALTAGE